MKKITLGLLALVSIGAYADEYISSCVSKGLGPRKYCSISIKSDEGAVGICSVKRVFRAEEIRLVTKLERISQGKLDLYEDESVQIRVKAPTFANGGRQESEGIYKDKPSGKEIKLSCLHIKL
jgi:hypothetical protein